MNKLDSFFADYRKEMNIMETKTELSEIKSAAVAAAKKDRQKRMIISTCTGLAACLLIASVAFVNSLMNPARDLNGSNDVMWAKSYADLYIMLKDAIDENDRGYGVPGSVKNEIFVEDGADGAVPKIPNAADNESTSGGEHSETNLQVEGVDEADIVKTDGNYIYILSESRRRLSIVEVNGGEMSKLSEIDLKTDFYPSDMYLDGDRLAVLGSSSSLNRDSVDGKYYNYYYGAVFADVYDISDRSNPKIAGSAGQEGNLLSSRKVGETIYLISQRYISSVDADDPSTFIPQTYQNGECQMLPADDIFVCPSYNTRMYTIISAISIKDANKICSTQAVLGDAATVYADSERLLLAANNYNFTRFNSRGKSSDGSTEQGLNLLLFTLDGGNVSLKTTGEVPGRLLNQFSIDRYKGVFRIAVTEDKDILDENGTVGFTTINSLYTFDDNLDKIGGVTDLAPGERIYSVRYQGDFGYMVTYRETDPLFAIDLSNPKKPVMTGYLKIPGFSQYLHPWGEGLLIGLGQDGGGLMKVSVFDVSDPADLKETFVQVLESHANSEALYNHKAILAYPRQNLLGFPASGTSWQNEYILFFCDLNTGTSEIITISPQSSLRILRGVIIGDYLYLINELNVESYDLRTIRDTQEPVSSVQYL